MELFFIIMAIAAICDSKDENKSKSSSKNSVAGDLIGGCTKAILCIVFLPFTILFAGLKEGGKQAEEQRKNYLTRGY